MGGFFGLSLEHKREDIVRSVLEGCALSIHQVLSVMRKMGARPSEIRVTGSQAMSRLWNQIKADVTGLKVLVPEVIEGEVLGAAIISAYGAGLYPDLKSASGAMIKFKDVVLPRDETGPVYEMLSRLQSTLYGALEKAYVEAEPAL
jgi:xylulokinase